MIKAFVFVILLLTGAPAFSQSSPPWERPLKLSWSNNGVAFSNTTVFQDSAGVPSAVRWKGDTIVCAFQWFRQPMNLPSWDRVAVKYSFDAGRSWTDPTPILVTGMPGNYQRPFDPTLAVLEDGRLRLFFSSSNGMPTGGLSDIVDTYSAISSDGLHYIFEPDARFGDDVRPVIDPAVTRFNGTWHYAAPAGAPQAGAFHCTSSDGLLFTRQADYTSDNAHNWTGNFLALSVGELRFYGSGQKIWFNSSTDGFVWQGYTNTNLIGGDPSVVRTGSGEYLAIYVGEPYNTGGGFTCGDTLIDPRDGKKYATVAIGADCWMKQNLNFGQMVASVVSATLHSDMTDNGVPEKYAMNNDVTKLPAYGGLYEWDELMHYTKANAAQGLCPPGWHVSTDAEWQNLIVVSGGKLTRPDAGHGGNVLKQIGEGFGAGAGIDRVGFSAWHSGDRGGFGNFNGLGLRSIFWTSTQASPTTAFHYILWAENDTIQRLALGSNTGFACRCVKNPVSTIIREYRKPETPRAVFPNPFTGSIHVTPVTGIESYTLMDSRGLALWSGGHIGKQDFSGLRSGLYFLHVKDGESSQIFILIKQ